MVPVGKKHQHSPPIDLQLPDETADLQPGFDGGAVVFGGATVFGGAVVFGGATVITGEEPMIDR